jgi:hypothetical protein
MGCVIGRAGDFLHRTPPRAVNLEEKWRRSYRKRRHFSTRGNDKNEVEICRSSKSVQLRNMLIHNFLKNFMALQGMGMGRYVHGMGVWRSLLI